MVGSSQRFSTRDVFRRINSICPLCSIHGRFIRSSCRDLGRTSACYGASERLSELMNDCEKSKKAKIRKYQMLLNQIRVLGELILIM